jgi:hypothetical protein
VTRICQCGCEASIADRSACTLYLNGTHRQRAYRRKVLEALRNAHLPTALSLAEARKVSSPTNPRNGDADDQPQRARRTKPTSARPALGKATTEVAEFFGVDEATAQIPLVRALSPKQQATLQERQNA